jgi:hypothetical protein
MNGTAVVVGGGIGGLAVAGGLTTAGGQVTVLERADAFIEVGTGIVREPNAVTSLDWLGADPLSRYARGRIALLGDAAHAITPDLGRVRRSPWRTPSCSPPPSPTPTTSRLRCGITTPRAGRGPSRDRDKKRATKGVR